MITRWTAKTEAELFGRMEDIIETQAGNLYPPRFFDFDSFLIAAGVKSKALERNLLLRVRRECFPYALEVPKPTGIINHATASHHIPKLIQKIDENQGYGFMIWRKSNRTFTMNYTWTIGLSSKEVAFTLRTAGWSTIDE